MRNDRARSSRRWSGIIFLLFGLILSSATSFAHPMGNFSVNHYSKVTIKRGEVEVRYLIDMAEIPTFQEIRQFDISPMADDPSTSRYLDGQEQLLKEGLCLESDGQAVRLDTISRQVAFADGAGGLRTMKIEFMFRGKLDVTAGAHKLSYFDNNFPGRTGWKEIVVLGDGVAIQDSSAPATDRSQELTNYSSDALNSPPQQLSALVGFRTSLSGTEKSTSAAVIGSSSRRTMSQGTNAAHQTPAAAHPRAHQGQGRSPGAITSFDLSAEHSSPRGVAPPTLAPRSLAAPAQNTPRSRFTELVSTQGKLSFWVLFSAALIAAGLGALHALEPGHGKTIVAAYLVGTRGTSRHAVLLGLIVTAAHTAGVYLLGGITLYASRWIVPEQLYPWLGVISGLMIAGLASYLFLRACTGESEAHGHQAGQSHSHWFASLTRSQFVERTSAAAPAMAPATTPSTAGTLEPADASVPLRQLLTLGITGGMVPCPAALVVLLSALSLHRVGLGLFLIVAFSLGLAAVLIVIGLLMVYARQFMARWKGDSLVSKRWLPALSSGFMLILGLGIAAKGLLSTGIASGFLSRDHLASFAGIVLLGLFLGMRHSTDPDHVVAVSTIVSRERSLRYAALIGMLWGVGHTLTISLVGSAIILFNIVIPPRVGLSMELSVAIMLILLGVLNLTGVVRWLTEKFTPPAQAAAQSPAPSRVRPA